MAPKKSMGMQMEPTKHLNGGKVGATNARMKQMESQGASRKHCKGKLMHMMPK
jgi:hypothetical protein